MWVLEGIHLGFHAYPSFHKQEIEVPRRKTTCSHVIYVSKVSPYRSGLISMGPDVLFPPDMMYSFIPLGGLLLVGALDPAPPHTYLFSLASESSYESTGYEPWWGNLDSPRDQDLCRLSTIAQRS